MYQCKVLYVLTAVTNYFLFPVSHKKKTAGKPETM